MQNPPQYSPRQTIVQLIYVLNIAFLLGGAIGFMFTPEQMVPGVNNAGRSMVRAMGALQFSTGYLILILGATHHGAYCLIMTFHFLVASLVGYEFYVLQPDSEPNKFRLFYVMAGHLGCFIVMLAMLVTGGIQPKHQDNAKEAAGKKGKKN